MNRIIDWFARNGVAANILMFAIVIVGGYVAFNKIVLREFPDYPRREIEISVAYRGSTPAEVEEAIVMRIEEAVNDVAGIEEISSNAREGSGNVELEIEDGYDMGEVLDQVKDRIDSISTFPVEAERPRVRMPSSFHERLITVVVSGNLNEFDLKRLAEIVRDDLLSLPNISIVNLKVSRAYEIDVEVSESTLQEHGLSFDEIVQAVRRSSINLSAGSIKTEGGDILLRTSNQAYNFEDFSKIVVLSREDGTRLTLSEVGKVNDGFDEAPLISNFNGKRSVVLDVYRTGNQNMIQMADEVKGYLKKAQERMPPGVELGYWSDDSETIKARLTLLSGSAVFGFILVISVLSLFLRPFLAFWVSLGIPVAFLGSFIVLYLLGATLNLTTLFAFILVLGIVVDDAIVTGENVFRHMQSGNTPLDSAIRGTQEVVVPVFFGVLTTILAFYPLYAMSGWTGNNLRNISIVVIPVLLFSLVESKLILPAHLKHCTRIGRGAAHRRDLNFLLRLQRSIADGLENGVRRYYSPTLDWCLKNRYLTFTLFFGILAVAWSLVQTNRIESSFYPRVPRHQVTIRLKMHAGTPFETTYAHVKRMERIALEYKERVNAESGKSLVRNVFATAGGQPMGSTWGRHNVGVPELGEIVIELTPEKEDGVRLDSSKVSADLREAIGEIPDAEQMGFGYWYGGGHGIWLRLTSPDFDDLRAASKKLQAKLKEYEGLNEISDSFERAKSEFELSLKPQAEHLGLTTGDLARQVRQAFFGAEAQRIQRGRDDIRVMIRYPEEQRKSLATLDSMMIRTRDGAEVPFDAVAEIRPGKSLPSIRRIDRKRQITVTANAESDELDVEAIVGELENGFLPELTSQYVGMSYAKSGWAQRRVDDAKRIKFYSFLVFLGLYVLLAIPFRSYVQPFVVMLIIPFGLVGAIIGHMIMDWVLGVFRDDNITFNLMSKLGFLALSGVVVNDSLILVHFINTRLRAGDSVGKAVRTAGVRRFRPILLTSLTTFAGLLPLMFAESRQAKYMIPMAISLAFGVIFATFIALLLVPVNTLILEDIKRGLKSYWRWQINGAPAAEAEPEEMKEPETLGDRR